MHAEYHPCHVATRHRVKERVRRSVQEGNRRRVIIQRRGATLLETPLTIAIIAVIVAPVLAAIAALAVAFFDTTIEVRPAESEDDVDSGSVKL